MADISANMLKAVVKMLEKPGRARVECAKAVLNEMIQEIETKKTAPPQNNFTITDEELSEEARLAKNDLTI